MTAQQIAEAPPTIPASLQLAATLLYEWMLKNPPKPNCGK